MSRMTQYVNRPRHVRFYASTVKTRMASSPKHVNQVYTTPPAAEYSRVTFDGVPPTFDGQPVSMT